MCSDCICRVLCFLNHWILISNRFWSLLFKPRKTIPHVCASFGPLLHRVYDILVPTAQDQYVSAFVLALVPVKGLLNCYSVLRSTWSCFPTEGCIHQNECYTFNATTVCLSNVCNIISLILYFTLFYKARKLRNRIAEAAHQPSDADGEEVRAATSQKLKQERKA
jgi:hypothetical protein